MKAPIKAAVIGAGWFATEFHIPLLARRPEVLLDGVCRLGSADLERVRSEFGFQFASEDYRALLARRPAIVVVASPHHLHYEHCRAALEAGADVLCEKPMTLDPGHAWALEALARGAGRHLLVANGYHFLPGVAALKQALGDGAVGRIEHVACSFVSATRAVFEGERGLARWRTHFFRPDRSTWQDPAQGGGFAFGQLSHSIAMVLWLTGLQARTVCAFNQRVGAIDLSNAASVACDGGAVLSLSGAAALPDGQRALLRLLISGTDGVMEVEFDRDRVLLHRHDGAGRVFDVEPGQWVYHCAGPVHALVDLALGAGANLAPAAIGAATVSVIAALMESAGNGGAGVPVFHPAAAANQGVIE